MRGKVPPPMPGNHQELRIDTPSAVQADLPNVVAIFAAQFHPRKGPIVVYGRTVNDQDVSLQGIEFKALPSGLHTVDHDLMYAASRYY